MFWFFGPKACGILVPWPGIKPAPPALEGDVLTTGPPGKSLWRYSWLYFYLFFRFQGQVEITKWILIITFTIMNEVLAALSKYNLNTIKFIHLKYTGLPWWHSGWESACQCRGHGFEPWSGKIPHATEQLGPWATTTEGTCLEPVLHNKRGPDSERPTHRDEEWPLLAATRESPGTETKTQHSHK